MEPIIMVPTPQVPMPAPPPASNIVQPSPGSILQPRVTIRAPPPFNYDPAILTQSSQVSPIQPQVHSVPVLMKDGKKFVTMSNLSAAVAATGTSHNKKQASKGEGKKKQHWIP